MRASGFAALLLLAGCAALEGGAVFSFGTAEPNPPVADPDACGSPQDCAAQLKQLVKDPKREWVGVPQSADGYSNGVRLFAYRALRGKLTCGELQRAVEDTKAAMASLDKPAYQRTHTLASEVNRELTSERSKRCRQS